MIKSNSSSPDRVEELKPCPRCNAKGEHVHQRWAKRDFFSAKCSDTAYCGMWLDSRSDSRAEAAQAWNQRTPESEPVTVMREALEEVLRMGSLRKASTGSILMEIMSVAREALARIGGTITSDRL